MRALLIFSTLLLTTLSFSQPGLKPDDATLAAMQKLEFMKGNWKGFGRISFGPTTHEFIQEETVISKVNDAVLVIDGIGYDAITEEIVHQAYATISYDATQSKYLMRAFRANGQYVDADFAIDDNGMITWGFTHPQAGAITYYIKLVEGKWVETGSVKQGNQVFEFFQTTLTKL